MSYFDMIKDINGKNYLAFENLNSDDPNSIGSKFDDFEILQKLGEGAFGIVFKVRSRINNKVYALKKLNLKELKDENPKAYQLTVNETAFLSELTNTSNQPHIVKYYKHFEEGDFLYIVIEFIENGDMDSFIEAHKKIKQHIPEEDLWSIFLQCMEGLAYVHKMGVIHRDIKPANLLMDNNMTIKLGDFGVSAVKKTDDDSTQYTNANYNFNRAGDEMQYHGTVVGTRPYMAKELIDQNEYDQKVDVYAMGVSFFEMCYYHVPKRVKRQRDAYGNYSFIFIPVEEPGDADVNYSSELLNIINLMLEEDKNKRQTSQFFLNMIKTEFSKKYTSNTSIDAIIRCLYSFKGLTSYYLSPQFNVNFRQPVTLAYVKCLNAFTQETLKAWFDSIKYFREIICTENTKFDKAKEIEPKLVLAFLLHQMHNETKDNKTQNNMLNQYYINSGEEKAKTSKEEMLINFCNEFLPKLNSFISQKFLGLMKITNVCSMCQICTYSFSGSFFVTFDLEKILNQNMMNGPLDIENFFYLQNSYNNVTERYCIKCLARTNHSQYKQFYSIPDFLIISIQRGYDYSKKNPIKIKEILDLSNMVELGGKRFRLVGLISRNALTSKFYSLFAFNNNYFKCEGLNIQTANPQEIFNDAKGEIIMAFYEAINMKFLY
mgnify:CR=1 FL=1